MEMEQAFNGQIVASGNGNTCYHSLAGGLDIILLF
jgi:hypothetical protein